MQNKATYYHVAHTEKETVNMQPDMLVGGTLLFNFGGCASINGDPNVTYAIPQATFNEGPPSMADSVAVPYQ